MLSGTCSQWGQDNKASARLTGCCSVSAFLDVMNLHPLAPPWLDGPARFDVGLKPLDPANWLVPDDEADWLPAKRELLARRAEAVFRERPDSEAEQDELLALVQAQPGVDLAPETGSSLWRASHLVSDDLVLLLPEPGGAVWRVGAVSLCSPTFFDAAHAIGGDLGFLHGPVPGGDPGLSSRIGRVFAMIRPDQVLERHNWTVQWSSERYTPSGAPLREAAGAAPVEEARSQLYERIERQTIRKLPRTGAVVFTIRIRLTPLWMRLEDPSMRSAFVTAWDSSPEHVRAYKRWNAVDRHVRHLLAHYGP
jgi:dimethylamine monooxygenase subunit A